MNMDKEETSAAVENGLKLVKRKKTKSHRFARTGWTSEKIAYIRDGLATFGPTRISRIRDLIPDKTETQIKTFLSNRARAVYHISREIRSQNLTPLVKPKRGLRDQPCLSVQIIQDFKNVQGPKQPLLNALLLISELEDHPQESPSSINFKNLYQALYMAARGYPLPSMNSATRKFFLESFETLLATASTNPFSHSAIAQEDTSALDLLLDSSATNPLGFSKLEMRAKIDINQSKPVIQVVMSEWMDPEDVLLL